MGWELGIAGVMRGPGLGRLGLLDDLGAWARPVSDKLGWLGWARPGHWISTPTNPENLPDRILAQPTWVGGRGVGPAKFWSERGKAKILFVSALGPFGAEANIYNDKHSA